MLRQATRRRHEADALSAPAVTPADTTAAEVTADADPAVEAAVEAAGHGASGPGGIRECREHRGHQRSRDADHDQATQQDDARIGRTRP